MITISKMTSILSRYDSNRQLKVARNKLCIGVKWDVSKIGNFVGMMRMDGWDDWMYE
jgi:hypothetical protein